MTGILFDLDGTLLNTLDDLADAVNHTLRAFGYPVCSTQEIRCFVGNGAARLMQLAVPQGEKWEEPLAQFQNYYREHCRQKTAPYPGVCDMLKKLSSRPIAIVSNKPDAAAKKLCAFYFPGIYTQGERPDCPRKPAPDMVRAAMEHIQADSCIYVGDSEVDVLTAANAGVPCLSVLWGFRNEQEIRQAGGRYFCSDPMQLPDLLETMIEELVENGK